MNTGSRQPIEGRCSWIPGLTYGHPGITYLFEVPRFRSPALRILLAAALSSTLGASATAQAPPKTATPIEHLIVVIGENISFDNLFGTYRPKSGAKIHNLWSQGIINRDGSPGRSLQKRHNAVPRCATPIR